MQGRAGSVADPSAVSAPRRPRVLGRSPLVGSPELAEDVAQDAWLRAVRSLAAFRGDSAFSTWLTGIAVRCALETLRQRRPLTFVDEGPDRVSPTGS